MPKKSIKDYKIVFNFSNVNRSFKDIMEISFLDYIRTKKDCVKRHI